MEAIWKKQYSLSAFTSADQFKSYDDLKKRMDYVLGNKTVRNTAQEETEYDNYAATEQKAVSEDEVMRKLESSYQQSKAAAQDSTPTPSSDGDSEDDTDDPMSYFARLADS